MTKRKCKIDDSFAIYYKDKNDELLKWWNDDASPYEIRYNSTKSIKFKCPYCGYEITRVPKFISDSTFKHFCTHKYEEMKMINNRNNNIKQNIKHQMQLEKSQNELDVKYGKGTWTILEFSKRTDRVLLKHSCGETKSISRFINAINNNLTCKCEL